MAIVNRTLDPTEQRKVFETKLVAAELVNGFSGILAVVPWPSTLDAGNIQLYGISGAPNFQISVNRFVVGTGGTTYVVAVGTSNIPLAFGTSGAWSVVLPAAGSTLLNLQANDVILYAQGGGSGAAAVQAEVSLVLKPIQDIKYNFGATNI